MAQQWCLLWSRCTLPALLSINLQPCGSTEVQTRHRSGQALSSSHPPLVTSASLSKSKNLLGASREPTSFLLLHSLAPRSRTNLRGRTSPRVRVCCWPHQCPPTVSSAAGSLGVQAHPHSRAVTLQPAPSLSHRCPVLTWAARWRPGCTRRSRRARCTRRSQCTGWST
jgi:hypothetical protein